jgi:hypothetical protein
LIKKRVVHPTLIGTLSQGLAAIRDQVPTVTLIFNGSLTSTFANWFTIQAVRRLNGLRAVIRIAAATVVEPA